MKSIGMRKLMVLAVMGIAVMLVMADTETVGGYTWTYYNKGDNTVKIRGDKYWDRELDMGAGGWVLYPAISPSPSGAVAIPSMLGGKPVTSIGESAFSGCSGLTSVTIPDSVTSIEGSAFSGCSGLTSVTIPNSVTSIGSSAFSGCSGLTSVTIPNSVTSIGNSAFYNCSGLTSVTIPDSVTSFGRSAFFHCSGLTSVMIGNSVTSIGESAFSGCSGLASVTIPDSVTSIGLYAFAGCSGLTSVTIGNGVTSIGSLAFSDCYGLESVTIPDSVTSIEFSAFSGCSGLTSVTIPDSVTSIGMLAFRFCSGLMSFTVGSGNANYSSANGLLLSKDGKTLILGVNGDVTIPDSVTSIEDDAFSGCSGLTSVMIPDSVTSVGGSAFSYCGGLTSVTIPNSVTSIGDWAFRNCSGLKEVWLPERFRGGLDWTVLSECPDDLEIFYYSEYVKIPHEQLMAVDSSERSIVLAVTNDCRVTFEWKCSCEPMRKGTMRDYLSFSIDGVQQDAICGEVDWTNMTFAVAGDGEHELRWTYRKDASGSEGEDCGWVRLVTVVPFVTLAFQAGGATAGEPPASMSFYADAGTVVLPGCGTLAMPKHTFLGWSDGESIHAAGADYPCSASVLTLTAAWARNELSAPVISAPEVFFVGETATVTISAEAGTSICYTLDGSAPTAESSLYAGPFTVDAATTIRAIAVRDDSFDSPETVFAMTMDATTFGDAVNAPTLEFMTDAGTGWRRVKSESPDGYALRSGVIGNNATSRIDATVMGEGRIAFSCKVAGEALNGNEIYDGLAFLIDGVQQGELMGNVDWVTNTFEVTGDGAHTLSWLYIKDESDEFVMPDDCAWLDEVVWVSMRNVTVAFDANGGELAAADALRRMLVNTAIGALPVPTRADYTFLGWFTAATGGDAVSADSVATDDVTLYAHWARVVRTVSFDTNGGGTAPEDVQVESGEAVGALPVPTRTDYTFLGWFTASDGGVAVTAETLITADVTLYAHWQCIFAFGEGDSWSQQQDGSWKSGVTADGAINSLSMTVNGSGAVSFRWKTSCEDYFIFKGTLLRQDGLSFFVDGVETNFVNGIMSGWAECSLEIAEPGTHTLTWSYEKDSSGYDGEDCAWVDAVTWTPSGPADVVVAVGGKSVTVPGAWLSENTTRAATDTAANGRMSVAECYVVGLDPEIATNEFKITSFPLLPNGLPDVANIQFDPPQSRWNVSGAVPKVKGKAELSDDLWQDVPPAGNSNFRFFKVSVELP